jgi:hypothetical protein
MIEESTFEQLDQGCHFTDFSLIILLSTCANIPRLTEALVCFGTFLKCSNTSII